jgi:GMP synthase (glutamine-hydrolysing)
MPVRLLLLQARLADDPMREHERECFVRATGLPDDHVEGFDLCKRAPALADVLRYDALSVGGSGDFYVTDGDLTDFDRLLDLLREVVERGHPTFASCFGYQLLVHALGGEIIHDAPNTEVGTFEMTLTDEGRADELFSALPDRFQALLGHKQRAGSHPSGIPNLAGSERSPFQALRIPRAPIWASQFHPELDRETNRDRFLHYQSGYSAYMSEAALEETDRRFSDSPEADTLLARFLDLVFG